MPLLYFGLIAAATLLGVSGCNQAVNTIAQNLTQSNPTGGSSPGNTVASAAGVTLEIVGIGAATAAVLYIWLKKS